MDNLKSEKNYNLSIEIEDDTSTRITIPSFDTEKGSLELQENSFNINYDSLTKNSFIFDITVSNVEKINESSTFNEENLHMYSNGNEIKVNFIEFDGVNKYTYNAVGLKSNKKYNNFKFSINRDGSNPIEVNDSLGNAVGIKTKVNITAVYSGVGGTAIALFLLALLALFLFLMYKRKIEDGGMASSKSGKSLFAAGSKTSAGINTYNEKPLREKRQKKQKPVGNAYSGSGGSTLFGSGSTTSTKLSIHKEKTSKLKKEKNVSGSGNNIFGGGLGSFGDKVSKSKKPSNHGSVYGGGSNEKPTKQKKEKKSRKNDSGGDTNPRANWF